MDSREAETAALRYHGGNLAAARRLYPDVPQPWIDLSTGINPVPYPVGAVAAEAWTRLPDPSALEAVARIAYGVEPRDGIVAAPGAQALIQWLPAVFPARSVGVLGFTYGEHAACWRASGAEVISVPALADLPAFDVGVVVNPNNPDGRICPPCALAEVAGALARRGGRLIVDEAFMDLLGPRDSLIPRLPAGVVVLRSFGKAYGLAGVRLGFAVGSAEDCGRLRAVLGPWAVSGPAIEIGRRAVADAAWLAQTAGRLRGESDRLDGVLKAAGFDVLGGTPLFRLAQLAGADEVFGQLCRTGILTRPFRDRPNWLRFGIPPTPEAWARLEAALLAAAAASTSSSSAIQRNAGASD
jgi:cobalamin biosynthesis protein CobC